MLLVVFGLLCTGTAGYCEYSQYFEVLHCGYGHTRSISGLKSYCCGILLYSSISGFCTAGAAKCWRYSYVGAINPRARSTKIISICAVYSENGVRPFAHRIDNFIPFFLQKSFTDGPTSGSWSKLLSGAATGVLRILAVFREYILRVLEMFTGSIRVPYS